MYLPISLYKSLFTYTEPLQDGNNAVANVAMRRVGTKKFRKIQNVICRYMLLYKQCRRTHSCIVYHDLYTIK